MGEYKIVSRTAAAVIVGSTFIIFSLFIPDLDIIRRLILFIIGTIMIFLGIKFSKG